jgi:hypothetical protein
VEWLKVVEPSKCEAQNSNPPVLQKEREKENTDPCPAQMAPEDMLSHKGYLWYEPMDMR